MIQKGKDFQSEKIWRCCCGGPHFVSVSRFYWNEDDEHCTYMHLESLDEYVNMSLWERIGWAWRALRGRTHHWCEIIIEPTTAHEISDELLLASKDMEDGQHATT